jgi:hypothetical protein
VGARAVASLPALGALLLGASLAHDWLNAETRRLYLEKRRATGEAVAARQRFVVREGRVEPQILAAGAERLVFEVDPRGTTDLRFGADPGAPGRIEVAVSRAGTRRVLARHDLSSTRHGVVVPLPAGPGLLELTNEGPVTWLDPRLVRTPRWWPRLMGMALLAGLALHARTPRRRLGRPALAAITTALTVGLGVGALEASLRVLSPALPWMAIARRDLGEVQPDPRWQDSTLYGLRLRPGLRTFCEWRHGDIVRLGFLSPELAPQGSLRFPLVTDAEGFRNADPPGPADVAALGDSFTDALTVPAELTWPSRLQAHLGRSVRNYGTAGFGPLQELEVLKQSVLPRRPRVAVLALFAGNDLADAELFDAVRRGERRAPLPLGWPIKDVIARFDELYTYSLFSGAARALRERRLDDVHERDVGDGARPDTFLVPPSAPAFDRGLFSLPVGEGRLRFALLPPYLNVLRFSAEELEARRGWTLLRDAIREMDRRLAQQGGSLVVMLVPSKSQVYLPLLASKLSPAEREQAVRSLIPENPPAFETLLRHRRALNGVVGTLCAKEDIPFLDLTDALEAVVRSGRNAYFPDDSHWNAAGHEAAARELAAFLRSRSFQ